MEVITRFLKFPHTAVYSCSYSAPISHIVGVNLSRINHIFYTAN